MAGQNAGSRDLRVRFLFVPHGETPSAEWLAAHPGAEKFPARFVPQAQGKSDLAPQQPADGAQVRGGDPWSTASAEGEGGRGVSVPRLR